MSGKSNPPWQKGDGVGRTDREEGRWCASKELVRSRSITCKRGTDGDNSQFLVKRRRNTNSKRKA